MKILFLADEESKMYWEYFKKEDFKGIDIIVSCGDLNPSYLSFLTTMVGVPLLYVHGNHDDKYNVKPPEGCICIEDEIYFAFSPQQRSSVDSSRILVIIRYNICSP